MFQGIYIPPLHILLPVLTAFAALVILISCNDSRAFVSHTAIVSLFFSTINLQREGRRRKKKAHLIPSDEYVDYGASMFVSEYQK